MAEKMALTAKSTKWLRIRGKSRRKVSCTVPSMAEKMAQTAKLTFQPNGLELEGKAGEK